jgi:hypothetical protein
MQGAIAIKLDPSQMSNPDADLRYLIPDRIEELTDKAIRPDGYDYLDDDSMVIFLASDDPKADVPKVMEILQSERFLGNNILDTAIIAGDSGEGYEVAHPKGFTGELVLTPNSDS